MWRIHPDKEQKYLYDLPYGSAYRVCYDEVLNRRIRDPVARGLGNRVELIDQEWMSSDEVRCEV